MMLETTPRTNGSDVLRLPEQALEPALAASAVRSRGEPATSDLQPRPAHTPTPEQRVHCLGWGIMDALSGDP